MHRQIEVTNGRVREPGVDHGGEGKVLAETETHIVVKWPGHKYWTGIGRDWAWASPRIVVYEKEIFKKPKEDWKWTGKVAVVIEWKNTRGK